VARRKKLKIPGASFSWNRALGITKAKRKISRATGIPMTRSGRRAKIGRVASGGGCLLGVVVALAVAVGAIVVIF